MTDGAACPVCGGPLLRRSRMWLAGVGMLFALAGTVGLASSLWTVVPGLFAMLIAAYLLVWSLWARGRWCRRCKSFPLS